MVASRRRNGPNEGRRNGFRRIAVGMAVALRVTTGRLQLLVVCCFRVRTCGVRRVVDAGTGGRAVGWLRTVPVHRESIVGVVHRVEKQLVGKREVIRHCETVELLHDRQDSKWRRAKGTMMRNNIPFDDGRYIRRREEIEQTVPSYTVSYQKAENRVTSYKIEPSAQKSHFDKMWLSEFKFA